MNIPFLTALEGVKTVMTFQTTLFTLGNSHAVRLPKKLLEELSFAEHQPVVLRVNETGAIVIEKDHASPYKSLKDRFTGYTGDYQAEEWDTGERVGKELL